MKAPLVSCIIVTYNSEKYVQDCLAALLKVTYDNLEIILVDNHSTDKSLAIAKKHLPAGKIFSNTKNTGYAGGHVFGMKKAKGEYVFLMNPDTTVTPGFLQPLVKVLQKQASVAACQPLVYLAGKQNEINLNGKVPQYLGFDWLRDYRKTSTPPSGEVLSISGSGVLLRVKAVQEVGGLDSSYFMYYEDSDLGWRLRLNGYHLWFCSESVVYHDYKFLPDESYQSVKQKLFWAERNRLYTVLKNYSLSTLVLLLPMFIGVELALLVFFASKGWLGVKLRTYASLWSARKALFVSRSQVQTLRTKEDREIIVQFASKLEFDLFKHPVVTHILNPLLSLYWKLIWPLV